MLAQNFEPKALTLLVYEISKPLVALVPLPAVRWQGVRDRQRQAIDHVFSCIATVIIITVRMPTKAGDDRYIFLHI